MTDPSMDPGPQSPIQKPDRPPHETIHKPGAESRTGRLGPFTIAILIALAIIVGGVVFYGLTTQGPETAIAPMATDEAAEQAGMQKQQQMQQQMQQPPANPGSPNTMQPAQPQAPAGSPPANKMAPPPSGSPSSSPY